MALLLYWIYPQSFKLIGSWALAKEDLIGLATPLVAGVLCQQKNYGREDGKNIAQITIVATECFVPNSNECCYDLLMVSE